MDVHVRAECGVYRPKRGTMQCEVPNLSAMLHCDDKKQTEREGTLSGRQYRYGHFLQEKRDNMSCITNEQNAHTVDNNTIATAIAYFEAIHMEQ